MNDMQRIWIVGANGRVGKELMRLLDTRQIKILDTDIDDINITNTEDIALFADMNRPHYIINCAGMTDACKCEEEIENAFKVNALGARNLSTAARKIGARIVHLSTDDVFDGESNTPYNEFDNTFPKTIYGKSKLAGENFVRELAPKHIIVRSSWVYGEGKSFVQTVIDCAKENKELSVPDDQFASPTSAELLAKKIVELMYNADDGLYHVVCKGHCSRFEFAKEILNLSGLKLDIKKISSKEDTIHYIRPSYTVLDTLMLRISEIELLTDWKTALKDYMIKYKLMK